MNSCNLTHVSSILDFLSSLDLPFVIQQIIKTTLCLSKDLLS